MVLGALGQNHLALAEIRGISINGHFQWLVVGNMWKLRWWNGEEARSLTEGGGPGEGGVGSCPRGAGSARFSPLHRTKLSVWVTQVRGQPDLNVTVSVEVMKPTVDLLPFCPKRGPADVQSGPGTAMGWPSRGRWHRKGLSWCVVPAHLSQLSTSSVPSLSLDLLQNLCYRLWIGQKHDFFQKGFHIYSLNVWKVILKKVLLYL